VEAARRAAGRDGLRDRDGSLTDARGNAVELTLAFSRESGTASALGRLVHFSLRDIGIRTELVPIESERFESEWVAEGRADMYLVLRRGGDAPDATAYLPSRSPAGRTGGTEDAVDAAETGVERAALASGPVVGLARAGWLRLQEKLLASGTVLPLARVRTWIVVRDGVAGPHATGTAAGPLWNAAEWTRPG
jgi:hypothetical protein